MSSAAGRTGRPYRGMSPDERDADRRRRLIAAGLEIFGTTGYAGSTIPRLCQAAGVAARNFYDHFASREELFAAVYAEVIDEHAAGLRDALRRAPDDLEARLRAGVRYAVEGWFADPRKARVAQVEAVSAGSALDEDRRRVLAAYASIVVEDVRALQSRGVLPERDVLISAVCFVGALNNVLVDWMHRTEKPPLDAVIDEVVRIGVAALGPAG